MHLKCNQIITIFIIVSSAVTFMPFILNDIIFFYHVDLFGLVVINL